MNQLYYEARKKYGLWQGVVYHYSNLDEDEVFDYVSKDKYDYSAEAIDNAVEWLEEQGLEAELGVSY
jgi:hypothetical protein